MATAGAAARAGVERRQLGASLYWQILALFLVAVAIRLFFAANLPARVDELYHLLSARSWVSDGSFRIWHGEYTRARYFTMLIGTLFKITGSDSLLVARLPSVLFGSALVVGVFLWVRREVGEAAAWASAVPLVISSFAITIDQYVRFYALHALLFWGASILVYDVVARAAQPRLPRFALAALLLLGALYLQVMTLIGIAALALWVALALLAYPSVRHVLSDGRVIAGGVALIAVAGAVALLGFGDLLAELYKQFRWVPLWSVERQDDTTYYLRLFGNRAPLLLYLLPFAGLVALVRAPRPAAFCLVLALTILAVHSLGGMKKSDYIAYTMLYLLPVYGIAFAALLPGLASLARSLMERAGAGSASQALGILFIVGAFGFALIGNDIFRSTIVTLLKAGKASVTGQTLDAREWQSVVPTVNEKWEGYLPLLRQLAGEHEVLLVTDEVRALYYLGSYDILINRSRLSEYAPDRDFARDWRTGGPVVGNVDAIKRIIACWPSGLIISGTSTFDMESTMTKAARAVIEQHTAPVAIPDKAPILVRHWHHANWVPPRGCDSVHRSAEPAHPHSSTGTKV